MKKGILASISALLLAVVFVVNFPLPAEAQFSIRHNTFQWVKFLEQGSAPTCPTVGAQMYFDGTNLKYCSDGGAYTDMDTGAAASMSIGGTVTSGTTGSVLFINAGPVLAQDNANFFWDDTDNQLVLGVGTVSKPTLTFASDDDTGIFSTANQVFITTAGVQKAAFGTSISLTPGAAGATGGSFTATASDGSTTAGAINLTAGANSGSGTGGAANLTAGAGGSGGAGGAVNVISGAGNAAADGAINFDTGGGTDEWQISGPGHLTQLESGNHINQADSSSDIAGVISISAATSAAYTFATAFTSAPVCVLSPRADPTTTGVWWVTTSTSAVTANVSISGTIDFSFHCVGNPN